MFEDLKEISFKFKIDPKDTIGHAARAHSVVKVMSDILKSYNNFVKIEFLKNEEFRKIYLNDLHAFDAIKKDLELLVVELEFSSFSASLAPNIITNQTSLFSNEVLSWKNTSFKKYKDLIINSDYNESKYITDVVNYYSDEERKMIYSPIFNAIGDEKEYLIYVGDNKLASSTKRLKKPDKSKINIYTPKGVIQKEPEPIKTVQVYAKIKEQKGEISFTKAALKEVLYVEEMEHDVYPYKPDILKFGNSIYNLKRRLECSVSFEDDSYFISNEELDITVWGETREKAEEAFNFSFHAMYQNYALERDSNLSEESILLKNQLLGLVSNQF